MRKASRSSRFVFLFLHGVGELSVGLIDVVIGMLENSYQQGFARIFAPGRFNILAAAPEASRYREILCVYVI